MPKFKVMNEETLALINPLDGHKLPKPKHYDATDHLLL